MEGSELENIADKEALAKEAEEIRNGIIRDIMWSFRELIESKVGGTIETILEDGKRKETIVDESGNRIYGVHDRIKKPIYIPTNDAIGIVAEDGGKEGIYLRDGKLFEDYGGPHDEIWLFKRLPNGEYVLRAKDREKEWLYRKDGNPVKEYGIPHDAIFEFFELPDEGWVLNARDIIDGECLEGLYREDGSLTEHGLHRKIFQTFELPDTGETALIVGSGKGKDYKQWLCTKNGLLKDFGGGHDLILHGRRDKDGNFVIVADDYGDGKERWYKRDGTIAYERSLRKNKPKE